MKQLLFFLLSIGFIETKAQQDSVASPSLHLSGYMEVYYEYDFDKPFNHTSPQFVYSHNRTNEVALNLAMVKASYQRNNNRVNLALMAGTYANANLANEPGVLKNIYEANIGVKLLKKRELWLDAGILPSHIGFESAVGKDCWTLTRSLLADNSPYYETGVRTSYASPDAKWYLAFLVLNGWQHIQRPDGNNTLAFGTQITFISSDKLTLNASTFVGNDQPDSIRKMRYFHNFYAVWKESQLFGVTVGFDAGVEQKTNGSSAFNAWYSPLLILRYQPSAQWAMAARAEYYRDTYGVIIPLINGKPFVLHGYSLNIDHTIGKSVLWRLEGKLLKSKHLYFMRAGQLKTVDPSMTTSLIFSLQ